MNSNPVIVSARGKHTATLVFLHGLGDTGHGWVSSLADACESHVKIVCPTAPIIPVTLNSGFKMPAWFDALSLDPDGPEDDDGIEKSRVYINKLIDEEIANGIEPSRVIIGGFSQGGALALYCGLTSWHNLGGIVALSCWLPLHKKFPASAVNRALPCLQLHGDCDPVVNYRWGQLTATSLKAFMTRHEFKTYKGLAHSSCPSEMEDLKSFISRVIPATR